MNKGGLKKFEIRKKVAHEVSQSWNTKSQKVIVLLRE